MSGRIASRATTPAGKGIKPMTEAQKAATFDLLRLRRVIVVRTGKRYINGKEAQATWIEHGNSKEILVDDFVTTLEEEAAK
jgi:hypothetical protein